MEPTEPVSEYCISAVILLGVWEMEMKLLTRAVSAALHTPQLGRPTLSQGAQNSSAVTTWHPRESFNLQIEI